MTGKRKKNYKHDEAECVSQRLMSHRLRCVPFKQLIDVYSERLLGEGASSYIWKAAQVHLAGSLLTGFLPCVNELQAKKEPWRSGSSVQNGEKLIARVTLVFFLEQDACRRFASRDKASLW